MGELRHVEGGEPESMMKMDPSFLIDSLKSPKAQGRLRAYKAEYRKDYANATSKKYT